MAKSKIIVEEAIVNKIFLIRSQKVMLDKDLAALYGIETKVFNQAVKRNLSRFPKDFMFPLKAREVQNLRSQIVTASWGGRRNLPYAFTESGVAMLSSILNSERAIAVNIQIIRIFTKLRTMLLTHKDILLKLEKLEKKTSENSDDIQVVFSALKQLLDPPATPRKRIGFKQDDL